MNASRRVVQLMLLLLYAVAISSCSEDARILQMLRKKRSDSVLEIIQNAMKEIRPSSYAKLKITTNCIVKIGSLFTPKGYPVLIGYADAVGKPGSGLFRGNWYWPGSFSECQQIADSKYCLSSFQGHIPVGNASIRSPGTIGVCMPKECNANDVQQVLNFTVSKAASLKKYISFPLIGGTLSKYGANAFCQEDTKKLTNGAVATISICGILAALCLIGTLCELLEGFLSTGNHRNEKGEEDMEESLSNHQLEEVDKQQLINEKNLCIAPSAGTLIMGYCSCFSVLKNLRALMSTETPKGAIVSINGIRTISMLWVILAHTFSIGATNGGLDNILDALNLLNRFTFLPITNGFFSVDSFFLLSGLLMSYLSMRRFSQYGKLPLIQFYLHRFLRLTPAYMFVILFYVNLLPILGNGPMWTTLVSRTLAKPCTDYWWTNLLYINNFYPKKLEQECIGWSWYLANDMQFFIISPLILYIMHWFKLLGTLVINGILIAMSIIVTAVIIYHYDLKSLEIVADLGRRQNLKYSFTNLVYIKPYCRIVPYLIGIILGYIIHNRMKLRGPTKYLFALAGWCIAIILGMTVTYGTWGSVKKDGHKLTTAENIMYGSFSRLSWGLAVAWVIYACHFKLGGIINRFLAWPAFIPLSRLTFGAYLIHPMTMILYYSSLQVPLHYTDMTIAFNFVAIAVLSYAAAVILAIGIEYPILNLDKKIFRVN